MNLKRIKDYLLVRPSDEAIHELTVENLNVINKASLAVTIIEAIVFIGCLVLPAFRVSYGTNFSLVNVFVGFLVNLIAFVFTKHLLKKKEMNVIVTRTTTLSYFAILLVWGASISYRHFKVGEQMVMFYVVVAGFAGFITLPPFLSIVLVWLPFIGFYTFLKIAVGVSTLNFVNFFAFGMIIFMSALFRYNLRLQVLNHVHELATINKKLHNDSRSDALTTLQNRFAFYDHIERYMEKEVSAIMLDVDYYKNFNDKYGHEVGDIVLVEIAAVLKSVFRYEDIYRVGGDEFLVIIPDMPFTEIHHRAFEVKDLVSKIEIKNVDEHVGTSYGIATAKVNDANELQSLIKQADEALYAVKKSRT